ncbi:MAG TPA: hypothetical protein ENJ00_10000 [Phycisphaerales bacterium]|nr:hypothetical protein [Phycisphaerales bacterium]
MKPAHHVIGLVLVTSAAMLGHAHAQQDQPEPDRAMLQHRLEQQLKTLDERRAMIQGRLEALRQGKPVEPLPPMDRLDKPPQSLTAEQKHRLLSVLGEVDLGDSEFDLRAFLSRDTPESARMMRRLAPRLRKLTGLRERDPELFELQRQELLSGIGIAHAMRHLVQLRHHGEASEAELQDARQGLKDAIARGFEVKAKLARLELKRAHDRYTAISEELEHAEANREQRINERFDEMMQHLGQVRDGPPHRDGPPRDRRRSRDD